MPVKQAWEMAQQEREPHCVDCWRLKSDADDLSLMRDLPEMVLPGFTGPVILPPKQIWACAPCRLKRRRQGKTF